MWKTFIIKYWLVLAIAVSVCLALLFPEPALWLPRFGIIDAGVIAVMFLGAVKLSFKNFSSALGRFHLVALSAFSVFLISPLLSLGLAWVVGLDSGPDKLAVLICTAQASTLATAIVLTEVAGADVALAMVITVVNNVATVFVTPLVFRLLSDTDVSIDYSSMAGEMALKIVFPVVVAQIARLWLTGWASRNKRELSIISQLIILIYIYAGVAAASQLLDGAGSVLIRAAVLVVFLHFFMLIINALIGKISTKDPGQRTAFVLCSSQKTLPAAILIWEGFFAAVPLGPLVAVAHHMLQLVVDSVIAPGFKKLPLIKKQNQQKGEL